MTTTTARDFAPLDPDEAADLARWIARYRPDRIRPAYRVRDETAEPLVTYEPPACAYDADLDRGPGLPLAGRRTRHGLGRRLLRLLTAKYRRALTW